jgi:hypothetical protein
MQANSMNCYLREGMLLARPVCSLLAGLVTYIEASKLLEIAKIYTRIK